MRYRLRTLMILLALGPPSIAGTWWWTRPKIIECPKLRPDSWDGIGGPGATDEFSTRCFILEPAEDPFGPDPCGCSQAFTPYSENDDDGSLPITIAPTSDADPFASL